MSAIEGLPDSANLVADRTGSSRAITQSIKVESWVDNCKQHVFFNHFFKPIKTFDSKKSKLYLLKGNFLKVNTNKFFKKAINIPILLI